MEIRIIILAVWILILTFIIIGCIIAIKTLDERLSDLERRERRTNSDIMDIKYDIDKINMADELRKQAELATERKERMADYLVVHASDSVMNRANALYVIANGGIIKEDK